MSRAVGKPVLHRINTTALGTWRILTGPLHNIAMLQENHQLRWLREGQSRIISAGETFTFPWATSSSSSASPGSSKGVTKAPSTPRSSCHISLKSNPALHISMHAHLREWTQGISFHSLGSRSICESLKAVKAASTQICFNLPSFYSSTSNCRTAARPYRLFNSHCATSSTPAKAHFLFLCLILDTSFIMSLLTPPVLKALSIASPSHPQLLHQQAQTHTGGKHGCVLGKEQHRAVGWVPLLFTTPRRKSLFLWWYHLHEELVMATCHKISIRCLKEWMLSSTYLGGPKQTVSSHSREQIIEP